MNTRNGWCWKRVFPTRPLPGPDEYSGCLQELPLQVMGLKELVALLSGKENKASK